MNIVRFLSCWLICYALCLLSCKSTGSETGAVNMEVIFPRDSTFEIKGISLEAPPKPITIASMEEITAVNANWITLMPYAFCRKDEPTVYFGTGHQWWGERKEGIIGCILLARQKNLKVMLKPHLWIGSGAYTGHFTMRDEASWKKWEDSYRNYILHFALLADSMRVQLLCIGTELGTTVKERPGFWGPLIDTIKKVYHGKLTYAANWDDYAHFPYWTKLDFIGIDAYFPLVKSDTPTAKDIERAWRKHIQKLEQFSLENEVPVLFTEYGYRNADNCAAEPWAEEAKPVNDEAQANAYQGFYNSFSNKKWFRGGFVWKWYADDFHGRSGRVDYTPQGKPALKIIRQFYGNK